MKIAGYHYEFSAIQLFQTSKKKKKTASNAEGDEMTRSPVSMETISDTFD